MEILLCDDHCLVSEGIELMLQSSTVNFTIHKVTAGTDAINFLKTHTIDVLILDISMPEMSGLDVLDELQKENYFPNVLMLTMHNEIKYIQEAMQKGAKGYILKNTTKKMLIEAIQTVGKGMVFMDTRLTIALLDNLTETSKNKQSNAIKLTPREIDVLILIAQNKKTKDIAEFLFISINTVQSHKKNLYSKLNIHSVSELIRYAYKHGFVKI